MIWQVLAALGGLLLITFALIWLDNQVLRWPWLDLRTWRRK
jgi:hypothetical protein